MAFEEPSREYGRQSIPLDLLFSMAERDNLTIVELIEKINAQDKKTPHTFEKSEAEICIEYITHVLNQKRLHREILQIIYLFREIQSEFPKNDPIHHDPELWILYLLKNLFLLGQEDLTYEMHKILKNIKEKIAHNKINKEIDIKFNDVFIQSNLKQLIKNMTKILLKSKTEENNPTDDSFYSLKN